MGHRLLWTVLGTGVLISNSSLSRRQTRDQLCLPDEARRARGSRPRYDFPTHPPGPSRLPPIERTEGISTMQPYWTVSWAKEAV